MAVMTFQLTWTSSVREVIRILFALCVLMLTIFVVKQEKVWEGSDYV